MEEESKTMSMKQFVSLVLGINATLIVTGVIFIGRSLVDINLNMAKMQTVNETMVQRVTAVEAQLATSLTVRYTASDAAADRNTVSSTLNSMRDSWTSQMSDLRVADRSHEARLQILELFKAKMEQKLEGK